MVYYGKGVNTMISVYIDDVMSVYSRSVKVTNASGSGFGWNQEIRVYPPF